MAHVKATATGQGCVARFTTEEVAELWKHIELHVSSAYGENPAAWPEEKLAALIETPILASNRPKLMS